VLATSFGIAWHVTHSRTHTPVLKLIPKSDVLVRRAAQYRARQKNGRHEQYEA
jgi:hypothetical protein